MNFGEKDVKDIDLELTLRCKIILCCKIHRFYNYLCTRKEEENVREN